MLGDIAALYRQSRKPRDLVWNSYAARPLAAVVLYFVRGLPVTPNQITFGSLAVFVVGVGVLVRWPSFVGLAAGAATIQASYILDCVDGQLARLRNTSTPVGAHLDFLMDELKAFLLVPAVAVHVQLRVADGQAGALRRLVPAGCYPGWLDGAWLYVGLGGLVVVASAISLTTFVRRPEYTGPKTLPHSQEAPRPESGSLLVRIVRLVEATGRLVIHYPSYILVVAALDAPDGFLLLYLAMNAVYAARTMLGVIAKLARRSMEGASA